MASAWILLAVGVVLIALTAVYVGAEFSLVTVDRAAVEQAAQDDRRAASILAGLRTLSTQLSAAQVGITVTTLALGYVMEPSLAALLSVPLDAIGVAESIADPLAIGISLAVATVLSMVFGELVPKNIAIVKPMLVARSVIAINTATAVVFRPLIAVLNGAANLTVKMFGIQPQEELGAGRSPQELESLVRRSQAHGSLEAASATLVAQSLRFSAKQAYDVLTPRVDLVTVGVDDTADDVIQTAVESGLSRFPVIAGDIDDVVGLVHVKRAVAVPHSARRSVTVRSLMSPAPRVPGTVALDDLMVRLRQRGLQMIIVADEYGGVEGIVTLEDVVEELIGEIDDEHDVAEVRWAPDGDGALTVDGGVRPDEIAAATGLELPEALQYETVAGLITEQLGRLPDVDDRVMVVATVRDGLMAHLLAERTPSEEPDSGPWQVTVAMTVLAMEGHRVRTVGIRLVDDPSVIEDDDEDATGAAPRPDGMEPRRSEEQP